MGQTQLRAYQIETTTFEQKVETAVQTGAASDDVVKKAGDTMSGDLTVPNLKAQQVNLTSVNPSDTATFFGTDDSGNSTLHMRIGNGSGDKIQIESWNGSAATSLMEVGQTTVTIKGDLVVSGTTTTISSETLEVGDNFIILNSGVSGSPTLDAGIRVERGSETDVEFKWNETEDKWEADNGLIVGGNIRTAVGSGLSDVDEDTYITVEKTANENIIHFYTGGSERITIDDEGRVAIGTTLSGIDGTTLHIGTSADHSDAVLSFVSQGGYSWAIGVDNNDSGTFKIGYGSVGADPLHDNKLISITTGGNMHVGGAVVAQNTRISSSGSWQLDCIYPSGSPTHRMAMGWYNDRSRFEIETWDSVNGWSSSAIHFMTDVVIYGNLSKSSGSFKIDHPVFPKNKYLYHGFVEAPRYDLIYRGIIKLTDGKATVDINKASNMARGTFEKLCQNAVVVSLQNLSGYARCKPTKIENGCFDIMCEELTDDLISWVVIAERNDSYIRQSRLTDDEGHLLVEVDKTIDEIKAEKDYEEMRRQK